MIGQHIAPEFCRDRYLSSSAQTMFTQWAKQSDRMKDATESALRVVINRDGGAFSPALEAHSARGPFSW